MAVMTWPRMIELARRGDYEQLCDLLDELPDRELTQAHCRDLSELIRLAMTGGIERPSNRTKLSPETLAHRRNKQNMAERVVIACLRAIERHQGKQMRGAERDASIRKIIADLPRHLQMKTNAEAVKRFIRRPQTSR
jgi:hypothetical protein